MKKQRLTQKSWIDAGLKSLVSEGPSSLAAESLARKLETTKGSFYWHFKDVPAFQAAVAQDWQTRAFADVVDALAQTGTAEQRIRRFGQSLLKDPHDPAMRAWALTNPAIGKVVGQVDAERLKYMANLLRQMGLTNAGFAESALGALVGMRHLPKVKKPADAFDTLIDMVLALQ